MKPRTILALCLLTLAFVGTAPADNAASPTVAVDHVGSAILPEWEPQLVTQAGVCKVNLECQYSQDVSCTSSNNQCSTSPNGECVVCDGATMGCCEVCTPECRSNCDTRWMICIESCFGDPECEGRCWANRDICYKLGCGCYV